jgi:Tol biopolymer transport system component
MRRALILIFVLSVMIPIASAAGDKKMTIEAALAIKDAGAPQWSPDGKWIAFTVSEWNKKEDRRDSHIYLVSASGGQPVRLTNGERGESAPQWSPDGGRIAFLANRDAAQAAAQPGAGRGSQVWMISIHGGEA